MSEFDDARDEELEKCKEMYFNGELGSDYYEGSLYMANWAREYYAEELADIYAAAGKYKKESLALQSQNAILVEALEELIEQKYDNPNRCIQVDDIAMDALAQVKEPK